MELNDVLGDRQTYPDTTWWLRQFFFNLTKRLKDVFKVFPGNTFPIVANANNKQITLFSRQYFYRSASVGVFGCIIKNVY